MLERGVPVVDGSSLDWATILNSLAVILLTASTLAYAAWRGWLKAGLLPASSGALIIAGVVLAVVAGLFLITALSAQVMPTAAVAVLMAPIGLSTAANLGLSPHALLITVLVYRLLEILRHFSVPSGIGERTLEHLPLATVLAYGLGVPIFGMTHYPVVDASFRIVFRLRFSSRFKLHCTTLQNLVTKILG